ncbi:L-arabinose transport system permease protein AraQ [compost metagenome]
MDFLLPSIVIRSPENYTLALGLYNFINREFGSNFTHFAAGSILIAVPIATVFLYFQRYLISGLTAGASKT